MFNIFKGNAVESQKNGEYGEGADDNRRKRIFRYFWMIGVAVVLLLAISGKYDSSKDSEYSFINSGSDEGDAIPSELEKVKDVSTSKESLPKYNKKVIPQVLLNGDASFTPDVFRYDNSTLDAFDPTAILLIKVPKVGGTTLSITLERFCHARGLKVAHPGTFSLRTCRGESASIGVWEGMVNKNGGKIDAWLTHSCFKTFMLAKNYKRYWNNPERQLAITMLREPWSRTVSSYRYIQYRCKYRPDLHYKTFYCKKPFITFLKSSCSSAMRCSEQFRYIAGARTNKLTQQRAEVTINRYDMVVLTERFNEGLVVLHLKFGFPWMAVPYMLANHNTDVPYPVVSERVKKSYLEGSLQPDRLIYDIAWRRMDEHIISIGNDTFYSTLELLNETNKRIKTECKEKIDRHDCLEKDPHIQHGAACFHRCIEEVTKQVLEEKRSSLNLN